MSQPSDGGGWLQWILGGAGAAAVAAFLWKVVSQILNYVTRTELAKSLEDQKKMFLAAQDEMKKQFERSLEAHGAERIRIAAEQKQDGKDMHGQNQQVNAAIFERLLEVEKGQARIEGHLERSGRYPILDPNGR